MCLWGSRESLGQGAERGNVVWSGREVCRLVPDMYESSMTVVRFTVGVTDGVKVEVGLHQGSALGPFLFAVVMDRLTDEVRQESAWTMIFADDIVICMRAGGRW